VGGWRPTSQPESSDRRAGPLLSRGPNVTPFLQSSPPLGVEPSRSGGRGTISQRGGGDRRCCFRCKVDSGRRRAPGFNAAVGGDPGSAKGSLRLVFGFHPHMFDGPGCPSNQNVKTAERCFRQLGGNLVRGSPFPRQSFEGKVTARHGLETRQGSPLVERHTCGQGPSAARAGDTNAPSGNKSACAHGEGGRSSPGRRPTSSRPGPTAGQVEGVFAHTRAVAQSPFFPRIGSTRPRCVRQRRAKFDTQAKGPRDQRKARRRARGRFRRMPRLDGDVRLGRRRTSRVQVLRS